MNSVILLLFFHIKLLKLLIDKGMTATKLRKQADILPSTL